MRLQLHPLVFTAVLALCAPALGADTPESWLTVVGDPGNPAEDIVEVDATSAVAFESLRKVRVRVNRAELRNGFDGGPYRSYYSTAMVDCTEGKAWHRSVSLFDKPLWSGKMRTVEYTERDGRIVTFSGMDPNPKERLLKAACAISVQGQ